MQIPMDMSKTGFIVDEEYDSGLPTKIIIHGWKSSAASEIGQLIKNAYLQEEDMNVICESLYPCYLFCHSFASFQWWIGVQLPRKTST